MAGEIDRSWVTYGKNLSEEEVEQRWGKDRQEIEQILNSIAHKRLATQEENIR